MDIYCCMSTSIYGNEIEVIIWNRERDKSSSFLIHNSCIMHLLTSHVYS